MIDIRKIPEGMEEAGEGIVVPVGTIELKREAWTNDSMKPLRRAQKVAEESKLRMFFVCMECGDPVAWVINNENGQVKGECKCKRRELID